MSAWKFEADLEPGALPRLLRALADVLEGQGRPPADQSPADRNAAANDAGPLEPGAQAQAAFRDALAPLPVAELRKLVLVARAKGAAPGAAQGFSLALKAKRAHEVRVPHAAGGAAFSTHGGGRGGPSAGETADETTARAAHGAAGGLSGGQSSCQSRHQSGGHGGGHCGISGRNYGAAKPPKAADAEARAREKYRQLKKSMQADYKALRAAAEAGRMPGQDVLESFLALSESMTEMAQPLKSVNGPEAAELARANAVFLEDARALRRAMSARDLAALTEVLARLERRRTACHAQFR